ncbi:MAG: DUF3035 domain-containing protein [Pseudomonadota bacterium]
MTAAATVRLPWTLRAGIGVLALSLSGCAQFGDPLEAMGARPPAPDEFKVVTREALVVPQSVQGQRAVALPRPDPGRPTPREPDARADAARALLGQGGGVTLVTAPSTGERVLVAAAAEGADADIREQLSEDDRVAAQQEADGPYQPPTIGELFGFGDDEDAPDPDTLVDPGIESQRLTRGGVRAPSDPEAAPPEPEDTTPREPLVQPLGPGSPRAQRGTLSLE